jgi:hypothetical protein
MGSYSRTHGQATAAGANTHRDRRRTLTKLEFAIRTQTTRDDADIYVLLDNGDWPQLAREIAASLDELARRGAGWATRRM